MKTDHFTKLILAVIAVALVTLSVENWQFRLNTVHAAVPAVFMQAAAPAHTTAPVHATAAIVYDYTWLQLGFSVPDPEGGMEKITAQMGELSQKGWEPIFVMPVTGTRNDNIGTGTQGLNMIFRRPK